MNHSHRGHSILLVDDHPLFRKGAAQLLALDPNFELLGEAASGAEGVEKALQLQPDVILLDLNMKEMDGVQTLQAMRAAGVDSLLILLTVSNAEQDVVRAMSAGADGYLLKDMEPEEMLAKLGQALRGQTVIHDSLTGILVKAMRADSHAPPGEAALTEREEQILRLIARGMSNKLIAQELAISDGTVKVHVKNLLRKLNLRSRLEAAVWALERDKQ